MKVKKFANKKNEKEVEVKFDATQLEIDEERPGFTTSVEDPEKEEKKFKKDLDKVEKFEAFINININNVENFEIEGELEEDDDEFDAEYEEEEEGGCGCCDDCTGEPGCYCGCDDCECDNIVDDIQKASDLINSQLSENMKFHLNNKKPITENIFRPGSEAFFQVIKEARLLFDNGRFNLTDIDKEIYESTEIGKFAKFKGQVIPLDLPMENIEELNEAEYKGKEVKLNYPMRGGSKKYYVYVKNPKTGKVKKISFGDVKGGLTAKVSNPEARKSFAARHKCSTKKDKTKAGYWACRINKYGHLWGGKTYPGYW
jgi:hypothetical protein